MRKLSLTPQENLERRLLRRDDGASFEVVADALTTCEPRLRRRVGPALRAVSVTALTRSSILGLPFG
jgi:hypothetical protein